MTYAKLFSSILQSTIWQAPDYELRTFLAMIVLADRDGVVQASVPGLAHTARVTVKKCEQALASFMGPDRYSRTERDEGRRVEKVDGGWRLINYEYYRDLKSKDDVRKQDADRQQRRRERLKDESRDVTDSHAPSRDVTDVTNSPPSGSGSGSGSGSPQDSGSERESSRAIPWHQDVAQRPALVPFGVNSADWQRFRMAYRNGYGEHAAMAEFAHLASHHPGGSAGLADELLSALERLKLSRPYSGEASFWPGIEKFLVDRKWLDTPTPTEAPRSPAQAASGYAPAAKGRDYTQGVELFAKET